MGAEEGILGEVIKAGEASVRIESLTEAMLSLGAHSPAHYVNRKPRPCLSRLQYGGRNIGVVAGGAQSGRMVRSPITTTKCLGLLSEQSAFAMGNAMIHQELTEKRKLDDELRTAREVQNVLLTIW